MAWLGHTSFVLDTERRHLTLIFGEVSGTVSDDLAHWLFTTWTDRIGRPQLSMVREHILYPFPFRCATEPGISGLFNAGLWTLCSKDRVELRLYEDAWLSVGKDGVLHANYPDSEQPVALWHYRFNEAILMMLWGTAAAMQTITVSVPRTHANPPHPRLSAFTSMVEMLNNSLIVMGLGPYYRTLRTCVGTRDGARIKELPEQVSPMGLRMLMDNPPALGSDFALEDPLTGTRLSVAHNCLFAGTTMVCPLHLTQVFAKRLEALPEGTQETIIFGEPKNFDYRPSCGLSTDECTNSEFVAYVKAMHERAQ